MRIAAIDIGSNSIHMLVCRIRPDLSFEVVDREKDMIRLAAGTLATGRLPAANIATAMQTLAKFRRLAESHGVEDIVTTATSAVREADNGGEFIRQAKEQVGLNVRVISGTEEARLIHLAAAYAVGTGSNRAVTIDIGGGSTEITLGTAARMELGRSFKIGVIRLAERFAGTDPMPREDVERLQRHIAKETSGYLAQLRRRGFSRVIGTSGTILTIGQLAATPVTSGSNDVRRLVVKADDIRKLRKKLVDLPLNERLKISGLDPRRADLAPVGAILIETLLERLRAEEITLCDFALREGLVLDYIRRNTSHIQKAGRYPDVRRRSVVELGERCSYYPDHAAQVAGLAQKIFDRTQSIHGLGAREREWLEYGALLHDVGAHISYEAHHKHSYYLIRHGELRGFDPEEVEVIGLIARYHRQALPKKSHEGFRELSKELRRSVKILAAMVRLAEGLDRSHVQVVKDLTVTVTGGSKKKPKAIEVGLRTTGDAELEHWAASRHAEALAEALNVTITFAPPRRRTGRRTAGRAERVRRLRPELTPAKRRRNRPSATVAAG
jgi:exopolyphosphatase/guanosine-5'-triphosphate,3'-diphosphate pyrophosphatase